MGCCQPVQINVGPLYIITMATNNFLVTPSYENLQLKLDQKWGEKLSWFNAKASGWIRILATFWEVLQSMIVYQHIYDHSNHIRCPLVLHFATVWKMSIYFYAFCPKKIFQATDQIRYILTTNQLKNLKCTKNKSWKCRQSNINRIIFLKYWKVLFFLYWKCTITFRYTPYWKIYRCWKIFSWNLWIFWIFGIFQL